MAISGEQSTEIDAPPEAVFAVASDLERYPEWQDFLQRASGGERDPGGRATLVEAEAGGEAGGGALAEAGRDGKVTALELALRAPRGEPRRVAWRAEGGDVKGLSG